VARAWIACGVRYVDTVDDFLVPYVVRSSWGLLVLGRVGGVRVAGVALCGVVGWSTDAWGREGRHEKIFRLVCVYVVGE
jgi:hypothetical protein